MADDRWGKGIKDDEITLIEKIGEGMYGKVFKGECRAMKVAVKIPTRQQLSKAESEAFSREIEIMRKITHPNLCLFMGAAMEPGKSLKIVTELLKGDVEKSIFNAADATSLLQRLKWAKDAAQGMAWLHGNQPTVLHRDLKPSNLLLDEFGTVKVTDFGLSDLVQQGTEVREVRPKGSPIYMAPEVMLRRALTIKVDIYSFAIMLWEIISKQPAFSHHSDYGKFTKAVISGERPSVNNLHPAIAALLNECWDNDPNVRPDFPTLCKRLDDLILEVGIQSGDTQARAFWGRYFPGKISTTWREFVGRLYTELGRTLPVSPTAAQGGELPVSPSDAQIDRANIDQQREFARRSDKNFRRVVTLTGDVNFGTQDDVFYLALKLLLVPNLHSNEDNEYVTLEHFGTALGWFGPFEPAFLTRYQNLIQTNWFHGSVTKSEAEDRLRNSKPGTFLVRLTTTNKNSLVISKIGRDQTIKHMLIDHDPISGNFNFNKKTYPSLEQLIKDASGEFNLLHESPGSIFKIIHEIQPGYNPL